MAGSTGFSNSEDRTTLGHFAQIAALVEGTREPLTEDEDLPSPNATPWGHLSKVERDGLANALRLGDC